MLARLKPKKHVLLTKKRRRQGEEFVRSYEFPRSVPDKLRRESPEIEWQPVERGLREWLTLCAYRENEALAMPSRAVDYAWHAFILDSASYRELSDNAYYGRSQPHIAEDPSSDDAWPRLVATIQAWDRTLWSQEEDATLWGLDVALDLENPWGVTNRQLQTVRTPEERRGGPWATATDASGD